MKTLIRMTLNTRLNLKCNFQTGTHDVRMFKVFFRSRPMLTSWLKSHCESSPIHAMNAEQRQTAADLWTKPTDLSHRPACRQLWNHIHHRHLLSLSLKADTHFTIPLRVEGWVDLHGWLHTQTVWFCPISPNPNSPNHIILAKIFEPWPKLYP